MASTQSPNSTWLSGMSSMMMTTTRLTQSNFFPSTYGGTEINSPQKRSKSNLLDWREIRTDQFKNSARVEHQGINNYSLRKGDLPRVTPFLKSFAEEYVVVPDVKNSLSTRVNRNPLMR